MTIPRKGSKLTEVHGKKYRYLIKVTHRPDHRDQKELSVTIQEETDEPGCVLQYRAPYGHEIYPRDIHAAIRDGLEAGWNPGKVGAAYYVRPASKNKTHRLRDASWGDDGGCVFLTHTGCQLEHDARPVECRSLRPQPDFDCACKGDNKKDNAIAWIPYHEEIEEAARLSGRDD